MEPSLFSTIPPEMSLTSLPFPDEDLRPDNYQFLFQNISSYWEQTSIKIQTLVASAAVNFGMTHALCCNVMHSHSVQSSPSIFQIHEDRKNSLLFHYQNLDSENQILKNICALFELSRIKFEFFSMQYRNDEISAMTQTLFDYEMTAKCHFGFVTEIQERTTHVMSILMSSLSNPATHRGPPPGFSEKA
jgi:hypothetical protein